MRKVLFLIFLLFPLFSGTAFVTAQVRIGANAVPEKGTVLDLKSSATAPGYVGGLLLPHVALTDLTSVPASWIGSPGTTDYSKLTGMLVYNTNTAFLTGIYVWDGTKWLAVITV